MGKTIRKNLTRHVSNPEPVKKMKNYLRDDCRSIQSETKTEGNMSLDLSFYIELEDTYDLYVNNAQVDVIPKNDNLKDHDLSSRATTVPNSRYNTPNKEHYVVTDPFRKSNFNDGGFKLYSNNQDEKAYLVKDQISAFDRAIESFELDFDHLPNCSESFACNLSFQEI